MTGLLLDAKRRVDRERAGGRLVGQRTIGRLQERSSEILEE